MIRINTCNYPEMLCWDYIYPHDLPFLEIKRLVDLGYMLGYGTYMNISKLSNELYNYIKCLRIDMYIDAIEIRKFPKLEAFYIHYNNTKTLRKTKH